MILSLTQSLAYSHGSIKKPRPSKATFQLTTLSLNSVSNVTLRQTDRSRHSSPRPRSTHSDTHSLSLYRQSRATQQSESYYQ